jgi:hypothetical protein
MVFVGGGFSRGIQGRENWDFNPWRRTEFG